MAVWEALWEHVARSRLLEEGPMVSVLSRRKKIVDYICGSDMWTPCFQHCYLVHQPDLHRLFLLYVAQSFSINHPSYWNTEFSMSVKEKHNLASVFHPPPPLPQAQRSQNNELGGGGGNEGDLERVTQELFPQWDRAEEFTTTTLIVLLTQPRPWLAWLPRAYISCLCEFSVDVYSAHSTCCWLP